MADAELWAAMAVKPIDADAVKARAAGWEAGRRSQNLAMIVTLLIFLTVPPIYIFESFVPLLIGGPLIAIAAVWGSIRALMPGGELDAGYANVGKAMAPLGLEVTERPQVDIETRDAVTGRVGPKIRGALVLDGERSGRRVSVRLDGTETASRSEVTLAAAVSEFEAKARDGKVRPLDGAPEEIVAALEATPNSTRWKKSRSRAVPRASSSPARAAVRPTGSATSGWPSDWPKPRAEAAALTPRKVENGPCTRLRSVVPRRIRRVWLGPGSPAAPAASA